MEKYARVIVDIAHSSVDKIFDYRLNEETKKGSRVLVPFSTKTIEGFVMDVKDETAVPLAKIKSVIKVLDSIPPLTEEILELVEYIKEKYQVPYAEVLRLMIPAEMRGGRVKEKFKKTVIKNFESLDIALSGIKKNAVNQIGILNEICDKTADYAYLGEKYGYSALNVLIEKNLISVAEEKELRTPYKNIGNTKDNSFSLTEDQQKAVDLLATSKNTILIKGVTGCGKTEIYMRGIENAINLGKTAIMLVPEIALTPQMLSLFRSRFGSKVAILHSGLSKGERFDEWWRLRTGVARIAVGARSAIFAPLQDLGIIIIDEEHETSYSSESSPRYETRDIATFRKKANNCPLVLGSATPSVESYLLAKSHIYDLVEINQRINKKQMPEIEIVDMRREIQMGNRTMFSSTLLNELDECIKNNNQAILFLNRRGYFSVFQCAECGYIAKCSDCDVSLTYHKEEHLLKCHYCSKRYNVPRSCPECGKNDFRQTRMGTEKIVEFLNDRYKGVKVLRMDFDSTTTKEAHYNIVNAFKNREAQILVGTQMIAKGHDFPYVTLVGILDADMSLYYSDYRSNERTFQLITQVAGRCGRADLKGKVVLQTYSPSHHILKLATKYDYDGFFDYECNIRATTKYPPFAKIVRMMLTGENENEVVLKAKEAFNRIQNLKTDYADAFNYLNAMKSPVKRISKSYRYQIIARIVGEHCDEVTKEMHKIAVDLKNNKVMVYVEVNPTNMI